MSTVSFKQFIKLVRETEDELVQELGRILIASAARMERQAKINATTFPKVRTGRLRNSITGLVMMKSGEPRIVLRAGGSNVRGLTKGVGDVYYAEDVELGKGNVRVPRYYLRRALRKEQKTLEKKLGDALKRAMTNA